MGIVRVYLALCVVAAHAGAVFPWQMHDGVQAVQIFYIISGFYMAMVLSTRYATPQDFYVSRIMRIFPPYWIVLVGTVALSTISGLLYHNWLLLTPYVTHPLDRNGAVGFLLTAFSNMTLIGQDWILFFSHDFGGQIHFTDNFRQDANPLWYYLLIPQCWSVGLELTFYAFAPYLNLARSRWLACIALGALVARLFAYWRMGLAHDPWNYRFFPFEISLFIFGMLGYRLYARMAPHHPSQRFRCVSLFPYLIGAVTILSLLYIHVLLEACIFPVIPGLELSGLLITYPFWTFAIPILFFVFGNQKIDRVIGELSYPIYLIHFLVIAILESLPINFGLGRWMGVASALACIILAGIFYMVLIVPIDRKRHSLTGQEGTAT